MPAVCPGVPAHILRPRESWGDTVAYDVQAAKLAAMFHANFTAYRDEVPEAVRSTGPLTAPAG